MIREKTFKTAKEGFEWIRNTKFEILNLADLTITYKVEILNLADLTIRYKD